MTKRTNITKTNTRARSRTGANTKRPTESASTTSLDVLSSVPRDNVAVRAYHLYLSRGMAHGDDLGDWLRAERELAAGNTS